MTIQLTEIDHQVNMNTEEEMVKTKVDELRTLVTGSHDWYTQTNRYIRNFLFDSFQQNEQIYINLSREITIASGVIAPFSLTLLGSNFVVQRWFLIAGFIFLLLNIVISPIIRLRFLKRKDTQLLEILTDSILGESIVKPNKSSNVDELMQIMDSQDYVRRALSKSQKILDKDFALTDLLSAMRHTQNWVKLQLLILTTGVIYVVFSVVYPLIINFILNYI